MQKVSMFLMSALTRGRWIVFLVFATSIFAQVSATLSGTVTDQSGAIVQAANVTAKNVATEAIRTTLTDAEGH
jgi:hypothetical protein